MSTAAKKIPTQTVGWAHMCRDVMVAAINKGQLPLLFAGLIVMLILYKMPGDDVSRLAFEMVRDLKSGYLLGYALLLIVLVLWYTHAQMMRRAMLMMEKK